MNARKKIILLTAAGVVLSSLWIYFEDYRYNGYASGLGGMLNILCWAIGLTAVFWPYFLKQEKKHKKFSPRWLRQQTTHFLIMIVYMGCILGNDILLEKTTDRRMTHILNTGPCMYTTATVINTERRSSGRNGGSRTYNTIEYRAGNKTVIQEFVNSSRIYTAGEKFSLKYAVDYPEMFQLGEKLSD